VLAPPDDLPESALVAALERCWGLLVGSISYRAVGWGSHHWEVRDTAGSRHWITVDDQVARRLSDGESLAVAFERLRAALAAATALRDSGRAFVAAPVPAADGEPVVPLTDRFAVAVYPFLDGQSFKGGEYASTAHRFSVLDLITAVHSAPAEASRRALSDDFAIPCRDHLAAACDQAGRPRDSGPYAKRAARLVSQHAGALRAMLTRYDVMVAQAAAPDGRAVLTHGEPHAANSMLTADGWMLLDWDTALVAPPERDLWDLDPGDGTILSAYAAATGVRARQDLLDLYRLRWDLTDIALAVGHFRRPHAGDANDDKTWWVLTFLVDRHGGAA
jgi:spectinomycin phosphotransferase/16S rRNA (guanine(1405)-N(7))-methyltransferase